jgi:hypothetical protein
MLLCMHIADLIGLDGDILGLKIRVRNAVWSKYYGFLGSGMGIS